MEYFVHPEGNDKASGHDLPWQTFQKAGDTAKAGDIVYFAPGSYTGGRIRNSGRPGNVIQFVAQDPDNRPKITHALAGWFQVTDTVWRHDKIYGPPWGRFREDNIPLDLATSPDCLDGQWFQEGDSVFYLPTFGTPSDHIVWARSTGIAMYDQYYVHLKDMDIIGSDSRCVGITGGGYHKIENCLTQWGWTGVGIQDSSYNEITQTISEGCLNGIVGSGKSHYNAVEWSKVLRCALTKHYTRKSDGSGIAFGTTKFASHNAIRHCEVAYCGSGNFNGEWGPYEGSLGLFHAENTEVSYNHVHDNYSAGIQVGIRSDNCLVLHNIVENNGRGNYESTNPIPGMCTGIDIAGSRGTTIAYNTILNNYVTQGFRWRDEPIENHPRGGLTIRHAGPDSDLSGTQLVDNEVSGTIGGPDIAR